MQLEGWEIPRSAVSKLETQDSQWGNTILKTRKLKTQEEKDLPIQIWRQEMTDKPVYEVRKRSYLFSPFLFYKVFGWLDEAPPTLEQAICFIQVCQFKW